MLTTTLLPTSQALPQTYSHYRQIKGDGNCGWRGKSSLGPLFKGRAN